MLFFSFCLRVPVREMALMVEIPCRSAQAWYLDKCRGVSRESGRLPPLSSTRSHGHRCAADAWSRLSWASEASPSEGTSAKEPWALGPLQGTRGPACIDPAGAPSLLVGDRLAADIIAGCRKRQIVPRKPASHPRVPSLPLPSAADPSLRVVAARFPQSAPHTSRPSRARPHPLQVACR